VSDTGKAVLVDVA